MAGEGDPIGTLQARAGLGDAGTDNSDASYAGPVSDSVFSADYYRTKIREFQSTLYALDAGFDAAQAAIYTDLSPDGAAYVDQWIADFLNKRGTLRATAEALNMGAAVVNAAGGRMPQLNLPPGLGAVPLVLPLAAIAATAVAVTLISWGQVALAGLNDRLKLELQLAAQTTPEARAALAVASRKADDAVRIADASSLGALAPYVKWALIGGLAFVAWRLFERFQGSRASNPAADD